MTKFISKMVDIGFGTLFLIATIIALAGSYLILNNIFGFAAISMVLIVGSALLICYLLHRAEKCLKKGIWVMNFIISANTDIAAS